MPTMTTFLKLLQTLRAEIVGKINKDEINKAPINLMPMTITKELITAYKIL